MSKATCNFDLSKRIKTAMDVRNAAAQVTLEQVAAGIGKDSRYLRAIREGGQEPRFTVIEDLAAFYESVGQPGFISDIRLQRDWRHDRLRLDRGTLPVLGRKLLDSVGDLRHATSIEELLAERGLLPYVHIMVREGDEGIRMTHRGSRMKTASLISREVLGRDLRSLEPRTYSRHIYDHVMPLFRNARPTLDHHEALGVSYDCLRVPVHQFMIGMTFDPQVSAPFELR